jgi:hypothetical protein
MLEIRRNLDSSTKSAHKESTTHQLISKLSPATPFGAFGVCIVKQKERRVTPRPRGETTWVTRAVHVTVNTTTRVQTTWVSAGRAASVWRPKQPTRGKRATRRKDRLFGPAYLDRIFTFDFYNIMIWRPMIICEWWDHHGSHCLRQWRTSMVISPMLGY